MIKKPNVSTERVVLGNSLINNHLPPAISASAYWDKFEDISQVNLGFFDAAVPDYTTFFPELKPEDLEPKEEDYYFPLVRALSAIVLNKWGPLDFSDKDMLKNSTKLLERQTLYANHEVLVGNEVGVVLETQWANQVTKNGNVLPAGINARLKIDQKVNPRLVRNMRMDPPSIHSFSVGVTFEWEKSHPKMADSDFWNRLGTYDEKDKTLVRRMVTNILYYSELSIVPHGADPYAQTISDKGINNAEYAYRQHQYKNTKLSSALFTGTDFVKLGHYVNYGSENFNVKAHEPELETILNNLNKDNLNRSQMELQQFIANLVAELGLTVSGEQTPEIITKAIKDQLSAQKTQLTTLQSDLNQANTAKGDLEVKLTEATGKLTGVLDGIKAEATRLYKLSKGDKASTDMIELIAKAADIDAAKVFLAQFEQDAEGQFHSKCQDCGSTKVTRMSASEEDNDELDGSESFKAGSKKAPASTDEVLKKLTEKKK